MLCPRHMRLLFTVFTLLGTIASANGTIVNTQPDPATDLKIRPSPRVRLLEIDTELRGLDRRTSAGEVFGQSMRKMAPFIGLSASPLGVVGAVMGAFHSNDLFTGSPVVMLGIVGVAGGLALLGGLVAVVVSSLSVFTHWVDEAGTAGQRAERADQLHSEREALLLRT